jgi:CheY-like chemotaxis protein
MDPELLEAFLPEWRAACARLMAGDPRAMATLRGLAEAPGAENLAAAIDVTEPSALAGLADALGGQATHGVLIIDDSPTMRRILREIVAEDAALRCVGEAEDGEAGLAAMARLRPALTLLDIEMPRLDGLGVLRHWALRGPGEILVVSSAAQPGGEVALEALRLGAAGIVAKPSGALSLDMHQRRGAALLAAGRRALGLPHAA